MSTVPLAYKFVCIAVMLAEINYCSNKLKLHEHVPITEQDIRVISAIDPTIIGFGGSLDTENYGYSFAGTGRLQFFTRLEDGYQSMGVYRGKEPLREFSERVSLMKSVISSNDAFRLTTNWLSAIDVDVKKLSQENTPVVEQQYFHSVRGVVPFPLFYVYWQDRQSNRVVDVMISGVSGEMLNLRQERVGYSKRPIALIKDMDKLLAIPDAEFEKYTPLERSNLLVRFAVNWPPQTTQTTNQLSSVSTNAALLK